MSDDNKATIRKSRKVRNGDRQPELGAAAGSESAEMCLAEIRAMMPREWEGVELPFCVLQLVKDKRRLEWLARNRSIPKEKSTWPQVDPDELRHSIDVEMDSQNLDYLDRKSTGSGERINL